MQDTEHDRSGGFAGEITQSGTGLVTRMENKPDHGEESYVGKGLLAGKVALITGGDSGIGRAVAIAYAREGADVAISYLPDEQVDADETKRWIEAAGRQAMLLPGDLQSEDYCKVLIARTVDKLGRIDILVNNASMQTMNEGPGDLVSSEVEAAFRVNVFAMLYLAREAAARMESGGAIINTTSEQLKVGNKRMVIYAATKGAIASLTIALSNLLAPKGIRVNCVAPGPIWTPIQPIAKTPEQLEVLGGDTPIGRVGQPAELAPAYVLLASAEGSYMTGALIPVTGGVPML